MLDMDLIFTDLTFETPEQAIRYGAQAMWQHGYVKKEYAESVLEREEQFPTGLPTEPFGIAIPHTNSSFVNKDAVCMIRLAHSLPFRQMGDSDTRVDVRLLFLLAVSVGDTHIELLSKLMEMFSDEILLKQMMTAADKETIAEILEQAVGI